MMGQGDAVLCSLVACGISVTQVRWSCLLAISVSEQASAGRLASDAIMASLRRCCIIKMLPLAKGLQNQVHKWAFFFFLFLLDS